MKSVTNLVLFVLASCIVSCKFVHVTETISNTRDTYIPIPVQTVADAPLNCPPEMVEVEGNYCPVVEQTCLEYDESVVNVNGKVRCMRFAPSNCLSENRKHLHFCMDKFEYQKDKTDPLPTVMVSFNEMKGLAAKENKRLCYDYEWEFACEGEEMRPYPNGWIREPNKCNIDKPAIPFNEMALGSNNLAVRDAEVKKLSQRTPIDSNPDCVSPFGIYNMSGNVDELLINTNPNVSHKNTLKGGHWIKGARNRCRPRTDQHDESFAFYEVGARLCKDLK